VHSSVSGEIGQWIRAILVAVVVALIIRNFVLTFVIVDGPSMEDLLYTGDIMIVSRIHYLIGTPQRGDVAMCKYPNDPSNSNYVKRVIGLPGETIECIDQTIFINDEPLQEPYLMKGNSNDFGKTVIPDGYYFVMGDNRPRSKDSRSVGFLSKDQVLGRAVIIAWPFQRVHVLPNRTNDRE
jgi:signal peptidase I